MNRGKCSYVIDICENRVAPVNYLFSLGTSNSLRKVALTSIKRLLKLKKANLFLNGVKLTIFARYFQFTHKSGFI